jgi:hypothetical protein
MEGRHQLIGFSRVTALCNQLRANLLNKDECKMNGEPWPEKIFPKREPDAAVTVQKKTPAPSPELAFPRSNSTGRFPAS